MKKLLLSIALTVLALGSWAQVTTNETPALTNNVQFVWNATHASALKALWNEDFAAKQAAYVVELAAYTDATNVTTLNDLPTPTLIPPTAPVKATFAVWASAWTKDKMIPVVDLAEGQRKWRLAQHLATANAKAKELFEASWALLTPAQQITQSNVWWNAFQATQ